MNSAYFCCFNPPSEDGFPHVSSMLQFPGVARRGAKGRRGAVATQRVSGRLVGKTFGNGLGDGDFMMNTGWFSNLHVKPSSVIHKLTGITGIFMVFFLAFGQFS